MKVLSIAGTLFILFYLLFPAAGIASFMIELDTGGKIITHQYWEEGDQIKFYQHGGTIGIPASMVKDIRDYDKAGLPESTAGQIDHHIVQSETSGSSDALQDIATAFQAEFLRIDTEFSANFSDFKLAQDQNDETLMKSSLDRINRLRQDRRELHQQVIEQYDGNMPEWWI